VAVSAKQVKDLPSAANPGLVDLRAVPEVRAGTFLWEGPDIVTGWHRHPYHQIEYALRGVAEVETPSGHYLLPPQKAIWIPAGLPHTTTLRDVRSVSVFFEPAMLAGPGDRARILPASPLIREMIVHGQRWLISRAVSTPESDAFFDALASVVSEWLGDEVPLCLPTTGDPVLAEVMAYTASHLPTATAVSVSRAVGLSQRTLRRRFSVEVGMTWRAYLLQSRLLRAMALLSERKRNIAEVSIAVGFASPSAFTRAFQKWTGESPSAYRRRVHGLRDLEPYE
jgi:AraC-like DNA-binding protein